MHADLKHPSHPDDPDSGPRASPRYRWWRIIGWSVLGLVSLVVTAVLVLAALVNTDGVHQAILNFAQRRATSSLGTRVRLKNFVVHWSPLGVDLYGVTVDGADPHPAPPLLQVNHIEVGVGIVSVFRQKWYLSNLHIDRPVAWVYVDKNGVSNIPSFKSSGGSSSDHNEIFNIGIRHALLDGGEIYYNNRPSALAADVYELNLRADYNEPQQMYSGQLSYSDGALKYGAYKPVRHNLDAAFSLTPTIFQLKQATLSSGESQAVLSAVIQNYAVNPSVQAQYRLVVNSGQFRKLLNEPTLPAGLLRASGSVQYQKQPNRPALQCVVLNGDLASDRLDVNTSTAHATITNLAAHYSLAHGDLSFLDLRAGILGGEVTAQGTMTDLEGDSHSRINATLHNLSLARLQQEVGKSAATRGTVLAGTLNATASATWGKTIADLVAHADAGIKGQVASEPANATAAAVIPVESDLHATYTNSNGQLALAESYIRTTQTNLTMNGTISKHSSLAVRLQANDLRELGEMANGFHVPGPGQQPLDLSGTASFTGNVQGSMAAPHITGQLTAMNLHVNGSDWKLVRSDVDASPDHADFVNAVLEPAQRGRIALNARATLNQWAFSKQSPIQAQLHASQIDLADLLKFSSERFPVSGTLATNLNLHGTVVNPEGNGHVELTEVTAYQQAVNSISLNFSGDGTQVRANFSLQALAGSVRADFTFQPGQRTYTAELTSPGIHLDRLAGLRANHIKANGVLALNASGEGSFDNPQLQATVQSPSLIVSNQTITALKLQMNVANHIANVSFSSTALHTPIQAKATVQLSGDYMADASLDTPVLSLQPILALYLPDQASDISGQMQLQAMLHGPLKRMKEIEAHVTIPVFNVAYQDKIHLAAPTAIHVDYRDGVFDLPPGSIEGTDTDLRFQGHIPIGSNQPISLQLRGDIDLHLAQLFDPEITSSGKIKLNIDSHGVIANGANLGGDIEIVNANYVDPSLPLGLQNGNGVLKLTTNRINVVSFDGTVGGGTVSMQGGVQYRPNVIFSLGLAAKGIRMLYPQGMRNNFDANIRLDGSPTAAVMDGTVNLINLSFTPAFDLFSFGDQLSGGVAAPPSQGFTQNLKLNLAVNSVGAMNMVSRELSVDGSANLQIRGTAATPVVLGRINLTGGDIILSGNRFVLNSGTIQFVNPAETEPVVNLSLTTSIQEYSIDLRFQGPVGQIHPTYSSNPALPAADIIHLLAFGSTTEAASSGITPGNQEAESLVASQVSSQVTSRISRVAGISQLSISPVLQGGGSQGPPGATITIRQRVTSNLFVTFSTNVTTTQDQIIQGQYQISPRVAISATGYGNGGFAVDTLIKKSW